MQRRIGSYQILEEIASGGQATVYRVWDTRTGRVLALKVMHPHLSKDAGYLERFHREAHMASSLDHPNIIRISEVGQEGDTHFIAMEYLPLSLHSLMRAQERFPVERAAEIVHQVCLALQASHEAGIVHRDIKPQNILMGPDGTMKLADFGIARAQDLSTMTRTGMVMGTPHYMPPEQARGQQSDIRSDLYSLGVVLYQMLAGQLPFEGDTPWEVIRRQVEENPTPVRQVRPEVPRGLASIVERCLSKEPAARYQTPIQMAQALEHAMPKAISAAERPPVAGARPVTPPAAPAPDAPAQPMPPAAPPRPSTTLMMAFARAWERAHRRRGARVGMILASIIVMAIIAASLSAMSTVRLPDDPNRGFDGAEVATEPNVPKLVSPPVRPTAAPVPSETALDTFRVDNGPSALAFDGRAIWVANRWDDSVTKFALDGRELGTFPVGEGPQAVAFDGKAIWVANRDEGSVTKLTLDGNELGTFRVGGAPNTLAFDGEAIWVGNEEDETVTRLALDGRELGTFVVGDKPQGLAFDGEAIWVANRWVDFVTRLALDGTELNTFSVGTGPSALVYDGSAIWVANFDNDTVTKLALDGTELGTFPVGRGPGALAYHGSDIWVANWLDNTVTRLALDGTELNTFSVGTGPSALVYDGSAIWVANFDNDTVTKLPLDGAVIVTFPVGDGPSALAFDGEAIWVANSEDDTVTRLEAGVGVLPVPIFFDCLVALFGQKRAEPVSEV